ncbi:VOC family protein [Longimicrobium sp.]|jgi:catechol 2,3-dioxygenase|uniref:VOC family protein n=1 Tax=Longimicrobium sp. TaxID=2029185 RepID=UPI002F94782E
MSDASTDLMPYTRESRALLPDALRLGPVRLAVADLDRAVEFYGGVLGLQVAQRGREGEYQVAHLGTGAGQEDVVVLQEEPGARPAGKHLAHTGLYHVALNYPSRLELARTARRMAEAHLRIGGSDHKTHEAIYLSDPDGNGLELAWDAPREAWPATLAELVEGVSDPLDVRGLLALTGEQPPVPHAEPGLRVGHVHLHVGSMPQARTFYVDLLGFEIQIDLGNGALVSAGRYHHHLGFNTWRGEGAAPRPADVAGLREWRIYLPAADDVEAARQRLESGGVRVVPAGPDAFTTADPWGIPLRVAVDPGAR